MKSLNLGKKKLQIFRKPHNLWNFQTGKHFMPFTTTQLELFEPNDEMSILNKELNLIKKQNEKLKKALSLKHNDLANMCLMLKEELDEVKKRLGAVENQPQKNENSHSCDMLETLFQEAYLGIS